MSNYPAQAQCPTPEDLAAYIDGDLSDDQRSDIEQHLLSCASCEETVAETVRVMSELGASQEGKSRPPWKLVVSFLAAAAVLLIAVGVFNSAKPWDLTLQRQVAQSIAADQSMPFRGWSELRGGSTGMVGEDVSFRLGVMAVDLEVAARAGREQDLQRILGALIFNIDKLPLSQPASAVYQQIRRDRSSLNPKALIQELSDAEARLPDLDQPTQYRLGRWTAYQSYLGTDATEKKRFRDEGKRLFQLELDPRDRSTIEQILDDEATSDEVDAWIAGH